MANFYVDQVTEYPAKKGLRWTRWSHLMTDGAIEGLHDFAKKCGLKREWFQPTPYPHYDITHHKRPLAVALGAIETTTREQVKIFKRLAAPMPPCQPMKRRKNEIQNKTSATVENCRGLWNRCDYQL